MSNTTTITANLDGTEEREFLAHLMPSIHLHDFWASVTNVPCPLCGGQIRWHEAGNVPGHRRCNSCHQEFLAKGKAEKPMLIQLDRDAFDLLQDNTTCHDIDTTGSASEHPLGDLARQCGHSSLTSCLNDMSAWGWPVAKVAELLLND